MSTRKIDLKITEQGAKNAAGNIEKVDNNIAKMAKQVVTATAALYAMKKGLDFLKGSTKAAMEQSDIFLKLKNSIEITGKSWGEAEGELNSLFTKLQATTRYGDTDSAEMFQRLIVLTGDYDKATQGLRLSMDLAASGLFDAGTASRYVGMAMTGNIEMLGRYISEFKTTTNESIKYMSVSEKVAYAVDVLTTKFGGLAEKELGNASGAVAQLTNYWGDFQEMIGDQFTPIIEKAARSLTGFFRSLTQTDLETTINELEQLGAAAEDIMALRLIQWQDELDEVNRKLSLTGARSKSSAEIADRIKKIEKEKLAAMKLQTDYQYRGKEVLEDQEEIEKSIYDNFLALYFDEKKAQKETEKYMANKNNLQSYTNDLKATEAMNQSQTVKDLNKERDELLGLLDLIIEKEQLQVKISGLTKKEKEEIEDINSALERSKEIYQEIQSVKLRPQLEPIDTEKQTIDIEYNYGEYNPPEFEMPDFEQDQIDAAKERLGLLDEEISKLSDYAQAGIDVSNQLSNNWSQYVEDTKIAFGEESIQYQFALETMRQAQKNYLDQQLELNEGNASKTKEFWANFFDNLKDLYAEDSELYKYFIQMKKEADADYAASRANIISETVGSFAELTKALGMSAEAGKALSIAQAIIDTYAGANKALAQGGIFGGIAAAGIIATGLANVAKIKAQKFALGGDFITAGPEMIMVGDNPGGRERVQITPIGTPNINGPESYEISNFNNIMPQDIIYNHKTEIDNSGLERKIDELMSVIRSSRPILNITAKTIEPIEISELAEEGDMMRNVN